MSIIPHRYLHDFPSLPSLCPQGRRSSSCWRWSWSARRRHCPCGWGWAPSRWLGHAGCSCLVRWSLLWLNEGSITLTEVYLQAFETWTRHLAESTHFWDFVVLEVQPTQLRSVEVHNGLNVRDPVFLYINAGVHRLRNCKSVNLMCSMFFMMDLW